MKRLAWLTVPVLLLLALALRLLIATRPLAVIDGVTIPDDAYLCLTLARSLAQGHGPLYGDTFTNGFQPLYVFLVAPLFWAIRGDPLLPVTLSLVLLAVADTAGLWLLLRWLRAEAHPLTTQVVAGVAWATSPWLLENANNGMETALAFCLTVAALAYFARLGREGPLPKRRQAAALGALLGLAVLARIDAGLLAAVLAGAWLLRGARGGRLKEALEKVAIAGATALAVSATLWGYLAAYTGSWYPVSGRAVREQSLWYMKAGAASFYAEMLKHSTGAVSTGGGSVLLGLLVAVGVGWAMARREVLRELGQAVRARLPLWAFAGLLFAAYSFWVLGPWFYPRYLEPLFLPLVLLLADVTTRVGARLTQRKRWLFAGALAAVVVAGAALTHQTRFMFFNQKTNVEGYMNVGLWAKDHLPRGAVVGATQSGALGYFGDGLTVVNLDGVVNGECYRAITGRKMGAFIHQKGVQYIVGWQVNVDYLKTVSADVPESAWVPLGKVPNFTSWQRTWYVYKLAE